MLWLASLLGMVAVGSAVLIDFGSDEDPESEADESTGQTGDDTTLVSPDDFLSGAGDLADGDGQSDDPGSDASSAPEGLTLTGTEALDQISGDDLNDTLLGLGGDDQLNGGAGDDSLDGGTGNDALYGAEGNDTLAGGAGDDLLHGQDGADVLTGADGADALYGHFGADTLDGGDGADTLHGGADNDHVQGGAGDDEVHGNAGDDTVSGGAGADALFGGTGDDVVTGADDEATGDFVNGGDGDDTLIAGASDVVTGGAGADQILLGDWIAQGTVDLVDFDPAEDRLLLVYDGSQGVPDVALETDPQTPEETILRLDGVEAMRLTGAESLTVEDILLVEAGDEDVAFLPLPSR